MLITRPQFPSFNSLLKKGNNERGRASKKEEMRGINKEGSSIQHNNVKKSRDRETNGRERMCVNMYVSKGCLSYFVFALLPIDSRKDSWFHVFSVKKADEGPQGSTEAILSGHGRKDI